MTKRPVRDEEKDTVNPLYRKLLNAIVSSDIGRVHPAIVLEDDTGNPTVSPVDQEQPQSYYLRLRQCSITNTLASFGSYRESELKKDDLENVVTIERGNSSLTIDLNNTGNKIVRTTTFQLLDLLTERMKKHTRDVRLPISEFMRGRKLKDIKEARKQVREGVSVLRSIAFTSTGERYQFLNIIESGAVERNGDVNIRFTETFHSLLFSSGLEMPYSIALPKQNSHKNPYSYSLGRRLLEHKFMNYGKENECIISISSLLESCKQLPTYEEVMKSDGAVDKRIISPFSRDLDALGDSKPRLQWCFCHKKGIPFTEEESGHMTYETFSKAYVRFDFDGYPILAERKKRNQGQGTKGKSAPRKRKAKTEKGKK